MSAVERIGLGLLRQFDPERAHGLALRALRLGLVPLPGRVTSPRLACEVAGLRLDNPVGLAAGFDKNAEALAPLARAGFGMIEVGAVTPRPQPGNPRPRLFRLPEDRAVINRFGFNNQGMEAAATRLAQRPKGAVIGLNLGANKDSDDRAEDFARVLAHCGRHLDFATVNVSSPNTEKLRDLQGGAALTALLAGVMEACAWLERPIPVFLKIAPDLDDAALAEIAEVAQRAGLSGIIATNTTLDRSGLSSVHRDETGGLSGAPLFERSTRVLARLSQLTEGRMPLIGVGGVGSAEQAYAKIRAGASAVQLYSALVYEGLGLVPRIARGLDRLLEADGFDNVTEAVGAGREEWL
ncbi:quinone-dependent dihydroorotate dehydrogenase [Roseovarius sp. S1116L3]|uniref:quinone-dependent dihydroorotate dehydrogenase n=1 Tax=Roseovarius roseus TaxID=3342636 RepID=UPI003728E2FE